MLSTVAEYERRWRGLVRDLRAHPDVHVLAAEAATPTDPQIARLEGLLGRPVPDDVRTFFEWTTHLTLSWVVRDPSGMREPSELGYGGSVRVPSITEMRKGPAHWSCAMDLLDGPYEGHGLRLSNGREGGMLPFDFFESDEMTVNVAVFLPTTDLNVVVSEDHGADLDNTGILSFAEYMDVVLRTYGSPVARAAMNSFVNRHLRARDVYPDLFGGHGAGEEPRTFTLDEIIALNEEGNPRLFQRPLPLPERPRPTGIGRITFHDKRYFVQVRGTTLSMHPYGKDPTFFLRVRTDMGEEIYLPRREATELVGPHDGYELARQNPGAFLAALSQVSAAAARGMFGSIWGERGNCHSRCEGFPVAIANEAWRVFALFSTLEPAVVVTELAKVLSGWLAEPGDRTREQVVAIYDCAAALTAVLARAMPRPLPAALGHQLTDLARAADKYGQPFRGMIPSAPPLSDEAAYWRAAVSGTAVPLLPPPSHKLGTSVGLDGIPLLD